MQKMIEKTLRMADEVLMLSGSALEESGESLRHAVREDDYIEIQNLMNKYASYHSWPGAWKARQPRPQKKKPYRLL